MKFSYRYVVIYKVFGGYMLPKDTNQILMFDQGYKLWLANAVGSQEYLKIGARALALRECIMRAFFRNEDGLSQLVSLTQKKLDVFNLDLSQNQLLVF